MESQGDQIMREMTEALSREMEFYKELRKRRMAMSPWKPKAELTPQQEIVYQRSTCDPALREVAKSVLEEVQYNRNERSLGKRMLCYMLIFMAICILTIPTTIYWVASRSVNKHKSKAN